MACTVKVWKALAGCQRQLLHAGAAAPLPHRILPARTFAAVKAKKKSAKEEPEKPAKKERRVVDDKDRHKPFGKTAWAPVDDVYINRYYPRTVHGAADAIDKLKLFQRLDFTPQDQPVYVDLRLDMKLEKKKKVDPFVSTVQLPHPFKTEANRVLVFTEDELQAEAARQDGAAAAGGAELIQPILDDELSADFYLAVPDIVSKLVPLKNKLRKKFPKSKRGSVGNDIPRMLALFKHGHEFMVEDECYVRTQIATLDMSAQQIYANLQAVLLDVVSHRPAHMGPFIERAIICSQTSEAVWFHGPDVLPQEPEEGEAPRP
ncbi:large ribosomal subunit protein uL1m [Salarias fasciatus]|uniref:large ribosomal subunit protein uL1m n=1 Tax=Salarias fasciatus TaxID=181472 RepID=UPI00117657C4|nr:39S ribosomal protein L1, mitochondrial [Salarias fasciatus]